MEGEHTVARGSRAMPGPIAFNRASQAHGCCRDVALLRLPRCQQDVASYVSTTNRLRLALRRQLIASEPIAMR